MAQFVELGVTGFTSNFNLESGDLTTTYYVRTGAAVEILLTYLLNPQNPHTSPNFTTYRCVGATVSIDERSVKSDSLYDTVTAGNVAQVVGKSMGTHGATCFKVVATYKQFLSSGDGWYSTEEHMDSNISVVSMMGNTAAGSAVFRWKTDDKTIHHNNSIIKILPKLDLTQKRVYIETPKTTWLDCLGKINNDQWLFMNATWIKGTVLCQAVNFTKHGTFNKTDLYQCNVKFSVIRLLDTVENVANQSVTWNHLYRPDKAYWETAYIGQTGTKTLYDETSFVVFN